APRPRGDTPVVGGAGAVEGALEPGAARGEARHRRRVGRRRRRRWRRWWRWWRWWRWRRWWRGSRRERHERAIGEPRGRRRPDRHRDADRTGRGRRIQPGPTED